MRVVSESADGKNAQLSTSSHCVIVQFILYTFPAVCWRYGAGTVFSAFVSLVFWGAPAKRFYNLARTIATEITPVGLRVGAFISKLT